ncbi:MAG: carbamoyltransferase HypF [Calditrichaeota bacterium]|nr:MAG: carbamoyltransferase HypF [Calditrichota bacterium]
MNSSSRVRRRINVYGAVQGTGFRPFVFRLASELQLGGFVQNTSQGLTIEVEGENGAIDCFLERLQAQHPPFARLQYIETIELEPQNECRFCIRDSDCEGPVRVNILPDMATCSACLAEMQNPRDRRFRYPFINCTNCGPRFSIIEALPYDRPGTSMKHFVMCPACQAEYENPLDRRFHAQPVACPVCGPTIQFWDSHGKLVGEKEEALQKAVVLLTSGKILAVKGLGGFHLMVDARNQEAVQQLRTRKAREEKPFALMFPNLEAVRVVCQLSELEERLLQSVQAPIVLLQKKEKEPYLAEAVAPGFPTYGVILPYTPLHHLLMQLLNFPVVATSGNLSEEPIVTDEKEALHRLGGIADGFLVHNRPIVRHVDDSVVHVVAGVTQVLRRARGYAPLPIWIQDSLPEILAVGGHLKNTVALARDNQVFVSQHIGDLDSPESRKAFKQVIEDLIRLLKFEPKAVACDLHPDYFSTRYAQGLGFPVIPVQHHHAHVVSTMAEHHLQGPVLGISWDGTGYGVDGTIWGGEFLLCDLHGFQRIAHLRTFPLPGGETAMREVWRCAVGLLYEVAGEDLWKWNLPPIEHARPLREIMERALQKSLNAPVTSSAGRLFDAVAAILGLRQKSAFEGQAAMMLEFVANRDCKDWYPYKIQKKAPMVVDWQPMIMALLEDLKANVGVDVVSARFHNTLVEMMVFVAREVEVEKVVLTGGCFQNKYLTERALERLQQEGFQVFINRQVPPGDGGLSLGQAVVGGHLWLTKINYEEAVDKPRKVN